MSDNIGAIIMIVAMAAIGLPGLLYIRRIRRRVGLSRRPSVDVRWPIVTGQPQRSGSWIDYSADDGGSDDS